MQAIVKVSHDDDAVELRDIPEPPAPGRGQVLLEVMAAGVCGSDIHLWRNHQSWPVTLPLVLGHEFAGVVTAVGEGVTGVAVGDRVACETAASVCGHCVYCRTGNYNLCPERLGYGALTDGAFTRYVMARPAILHPVPEGLSFAEAALTEPVCVAYNALVEQARVRPGDTVVIQGPGTIGIMALLVAKLHGANPIVMVGTDRDRQRLALARDLGATETVVLGERDLVEVIRGLGDGFGADVVVDVTGVSAALEQSLALVRPGGQIVKVGWGPQPLGFSLDPLVAKAVTLQGSFSHTWPTWERVLKLLASGQIDLKPLTTTYALSDWRAAFTDMESGANVKSLLLPD